MKSVKLKADTVELLRDLRGRYGSTYDAVIRELVRRETANISGSLFYMQRAERIETLLLRLVDSKDDSKAAPLPNSFTIE